MVLFKCKMIVKYVSDRKHVVKIATWKVEHVPKQLASA